ncbi:hypothetical protein ABZ154_09330 [Streptomyces sp. NPDC006261]|uniref:hypothetical protein n=1 Tax=Streptomyces sp. NPDC006261 TaxID=3156739 RepID=UPI0033A4C1AC
MALDKTTEWDVHGYLLARLCDSMELSNYLFIQANSSGENQDAMEAPTPIQRPGQPDEPEPTPPKPEDFASGKEVAAFFGRMNSL